MSDEDRIIAEARHIDPAFALPHAGEPGPYERCDDPALAVAVRVIDLNGCADEALADDEFGLSGCVVDRFVLLTDEQGFHTLIKCRNAVEAYQKLVDAFQGCEGG